MKKLLPLLFTLTIILTTTNIYSQLTELSFNSRISQSNAIIEGKVIGKNSYWDINQYNIYTINKVEVYKVFKGNITSTIIEVITPGGTVGYQRETVEPSLSLSINEVGIFMLTNSTVAFQGNSIYSRFKPYAGPQGFLEYDLYNNKASGPFDNFFNIENNLYVNIQSLTNSTYSTIAPFSTKVKGGINNKATSITSFTPTTVTAGTETLLTITGTDFGASAGTVLFSNADDGGATFDPGLPTEIISWNNTQIVVEVYQDAGTGSIQVIGTGTATSAQTLTVSYAEINAEFDPGSGTESYLTRHVDRNGNGGYVWQMHTDFDASAANASFVRAMETWRCNSGIYWEIGATTTTDVIANDNINVVRFDNGTELDPGTLGVCTSRWSGCGGATIDWYVEELDIVFDDGTNWNYTTSAPGVTEYDFESVAVHELGHGHQLGHVIDNSDVMHYSISNGTSNHTPNFAGGIDVQSRSTGGSVCSQTVMTNYSCGAAPVAEFSAASTILCEGTSTIFTDASTNTPTSWAWVFTPATVTFINSTTSSSQNPEVQFNAAGSYQAELTATNASGSDVETKVGYITVDPLPGAAGAITGSIVECENETGVPYSISAVADATTYVWSVPAGAIVATGQNTTSITVDFGTSSGNVSVTPNNSCGNGGTGIKAITINNAPAITSQPNNSTITEGNNTSFSVVANNATGYQWQVNTGSGFNNLSNVGVYSTVTTPTMNITAATLSMDGYLYRCVVSGTCTPNATSNSATLNVNPASGLPTTQLAPSSCGITLPNSNSITYATTVVGASYYIFNVSNVGLGYNQTKTAWAGGWAIILDNFPGIQYNTTYDVKVKVVIGPDTSDYGNICQVTTAPAYSLPTTKLNQNYCGITLANTNDLVYANAVNGASYYIFNVSNTGLGYNQTKTAWTGGNGGQAIRLSNFPGIQINTTYDVKIKVVIGPDTSAYGAVCQVTTPAIYAPAMLTSTSCNKTLTNFSDVIYSNTVNGATSYIFNIVNVGLGFDYTKTAWAGGWAIRLDQIPGIQLNTTYDIRVKVVIGADTSAYGNICQVTTPITARYGNFTDDTFKSEPINETYSNLKMKVYPNPSQGEFVYLELKGISPNAKILVTDIYGKGILNQPIKSDYENYSGTLRFNKNLDAGFYLITVISGDQKITKKLIVR